MSAAKHAQRQQLVAPLPPLLRHDEQPQGDGREAKVDGDLGVRPRDLVPAKLNREEEEDQEGGEQERPEKVDLAEFLARRCRISGRLARLGARPMFGLRIGHKDPAEEEGQQEEGRLADEGPFFSPGVSEPVRLVGGIDSRG